MSIIISFKDNLLFDLLNDSSLDNHTGFTVDLKTLSCEVKPLNTAAASAGGFIYLAIFLLAVPGNLLVGWVIMTSRQALTPSDIYLFHLTIADSLMALTIPFAAVAAVKGWIFGDFMCKLLTLIFDANFYTSILFLVCISVDRYLVIVRACESLRTQQKMCSRLLCASVWALGSALALPALFSDAVKLDMDLDIMTCMETFDIGTASLWRIANRGLRHIFGFLLPLLVMVTCSSITIMRLLRTKGFKKYRAMRVIVAVVIAFLLCWMPYHLTLMVDTLLRSNVIAKDCALKTTVDMALHITRSLGLMHCCINPVLYAFVGEKFRRKIKVLYQRRARQEMMSRSKFSRSTSQTSEGSGPVF